MAFPLEVSELRVNADSDNDFTTLTESSLVSILAGISTLATAVSDIDALKSALAEGRRVPVVLARNTTVQTVAANMSEWAVFAFSIPVADAVAGTIVTVDVGGVMAGFGFDDNTYAVELLFEGAPVVQFAAAMLTDPTPWEARLRLVLTSTTAGRWDMKVEPDDFEQSGSPPFHVQRAAGTFSGGVGDLSFVLMARRGGTTSSDESLTMDYSLATLIRP